MVPNEIKALSHSYTKENIIPCDNIGGLIPIPSVLMLIVSPIRLHINIEIMYKWAKRLIIKTFQQLFLHISPKILAFPKLKSNN